MDEPNVSGAAGRRRDEDIALDMMKFIAVTTAYGKAGWFYETWRGEEQWERVKVTAQECPRIDPAFLTEERAALGARIYSREYECTFTEADDAVFAEADLRRMLDSDAEPSSRLRSSRLEYLEWQ